MSFLFCSQDENRQMVVQGLITHLVLSKRIAMLDQFAAGLETLDVLPAVRDKPAIFESLFVASARRISPESVKSVFKLKPSASQCTEATTIFNMVKNYIEDSSEEGEILLDAFKGELIDPIAKHLNAGSSCVFFVDCELDISLLKISSYLKACFKSEIGNIISRRHVFA